VSKQRKSLGRGLNALIPTVERTAPTIPTGTAVVEMPVEKVSANPHQPRQVLDQESLAELAASIRTHGVLQPLVVTKVDDGYQIIAGERRWRAAQLAEMETVPVLIKESTPQQMLEMALVENIQRADLNPLEEANAYRQLMDEFGLTQGKVAEQVGKSRTSVANTVRLLKLPDEAKQALLAGHISEGHARALLALPTIGMQRQALATIQKHGLNVRQTENLVRQMQAKLDESRPAESPPPLSPLDRQVVERFRTRLGTKVNLIRGKRGGRLVIHFYSDEELQTIYQAVVDPEESQ